MSLSGSASSDHQVMKDANGVEGLKVISPWDVRCSSVARERRYLEKILAVRTEALASMLVLGSRVSVGSHLHIGIVFHNWCEGIQEDERSIN